MARFGGLTDEVRHGQCAVEENAEAFDRVRDGDCGMVKLKGMKDRFCLVSMRIASVFLLFI